MATHDPHLEFEPLPPVPDRRAPERRAYGGRLEERTQVARTIASAGIAVCGGLVVLFLFFAVIGQFSFGDAAAATIAVCALALVWVVGRLYRRGHREELSTVRRDRERRGF